jgi:hypothetical protein
MKVGCRKAVSLVCVPEVIFCSLPFLGVRPTMTPTISDPSRHPAVMAFRPTGVYTVITDLDIDWCSPSEPISANACDLHTWYRIEKDLFLHSQEQPAWLKIKRKKPSSLTFADLVVVDIRIGKSQTTSATDALWESRPYGIWILRRNYDGWLSHAVTCVDILFGVDAVEPRPQWIVLQEPLELEAGSEVPVARLSLRHGKPRPQSPTPRLTVKEDSTFKIVQISDTHMVTGVGTCKDAIDEDGRFLPASVADPLTVKFLGEVLDLEKPDLVLLTGDQIHHDIPDSQSAIFKVVAPLIERSIPFAAVFGNHDSEGEHALSREHHFLMNTRFDFRFANEAVSSPTF